MDGHPILVILYRPIVRYMLLPNITALAHATANAPIDIVNVHVVAQQPIILSIEHHHIGTLTAIVVQDEIVEVVIVVIEVLISVLLLTFCVIHPVLLS